MSFQGFTLLPADDPASTPDEDLAAAVEGALALAQDVTPLPEDPPVPFGRSWDFDWDTGHFRRQGQSPAPVSEFNTLAQWCQMAIHTARYSSPIFSDDFGMDEPEGVIGSFPDAEAISDWQRALVDALMVHDRITSVENVSLRWDPEAGVLYIDSMDIITDEDVTLTVSDVTLQAGGA